MVPSALVFSLGDESLYEILNRMVVAVQELDSRGLTVPGSLQEFMDEGNAGTLAAGGVVFGIAMIALMYHSSVIPLRLHITCVNDFPNSFLCMVSGASCMQSVMLRIHIAQLKVQELRWFTPKLSTKIACIAPKSSKNVHTLQTYHMTK